MKYKKRKDLPSYCLWIVFVLINNTINLSFEYRDGFEYLTGTIISSIILMVIDFLIFKIAWKLTRNWIIITEANSSESSHFHWICRCILAIALFAFSFTPFCSLLLTPIVHRVHDIVCFYFLYIIDRINVIIQDAFSSLSIV